MHARQHPHERSDASDYDPLPGGVKDKRLIMVNGKPAMEYDGLVNAELAWILGRRFKNFNSTGQPGTVGPPGNNTLDELSETQRYAHQAYAGLGSGVDRMQRLASTAWIENMVKTALGTVRIDLHEIVLGTPYQGGMDSLIHDWSNFLFGTATMCADPLAQRLAADIAARGGLPVAADTSHIGHELSKLRREKLSGVLFLEKGPFLRGFQVDTEAIDMSAFKGHEGHGRCSRNIGDACVMSAIELEIRRRNLMDWTPDGIILSKLESPTDEPHKSIEMDARSAQLFNVAVQGPAISTTWTSDVRDFKLECQPMDKVFICLVADVSWTLCDATAKYGEIQGLRNVAKDRWGEYIDAKTYEEREAARERFLAAVQAAQNKVSELVGVFNAGNDPAYIGLYGTAMRLHNAYKTLSSTPGSDPDDIERARKDSVAATERANKRKEFTYKDDDEIKAKMDQIDELQGQIRAGVVSGAKVVMHNFRLKRSTSSHMINYSKWDPKRKGSRLDLKFGEINGTGFGATGVAEYIVGAWCIGTVLDSAASRSTVGSLVRTAPTSMALNINVNIEWWSSDKLYKHYMDRSGLTLMRQEEIPLDPADPSRKRRYDDADLDRGIDLAAAAPPAAPPPPPPPPPPGFVQDPDNPGANIPAGGGGMESSAAGRSGLAGLAGARVTGTGSRSRAR